LDTSSKHAGSTLLIYIVGTVAGERGHHFDLVRCKEGGGVFLASFAENREVAPVHDVTIQGACFGDEVAKVRVEFRGSAGDVDGMNLWAALEYLEDLVHGAEGHCLRSSGSSIHVAVAAGLIAALPEVDLQGGGAGATQSGDAIGREGLFKKVHRVQQHSAVPRTPVTEMVESYSRSIASAGIGASWLVSWLTWPYNSASTVLGTPA
jgi:hypothetical protein